MSDPPDPDATGTYYPRPPAHPAGESFGPAPRSPAGTESSRPWVSAGWARSTAPMTSPWGQSVALKFLPAGLARDRLRGGRLPAIEVLPSC
jgi:hypothetical protein